MDSLDDPKTKAQARKGASGGGQVQTKGSPQGEGEHFIKYVLQEPLWLLMANADDKVMMTYQVPSRYVGRSLEGAGPESGLSLTLLCFLTTGTCRRFCEKTRRGCGRCRRASPTSPRSSGGSWWRSTPG